MNAHNDTATLLDEFKRLAVRALELEAEALFEDHAISAAQAAEFDSVA